MTTRLLFGAFLILHGLIHLSWVTPQPSDPRYPFDVTHSKLIRGARPEMLRSTGSALAVLATGQFAAAGIALIALPGLPMLWRMLAVVACLDSLVLIAVFWHRWLALGPLIDAGILAAAMMGWPS